jgi:ankyrin repeat protein
MQAIDPNVGRALIIATAMAHTGYKSAVSQLLELSTAFATDKTLLTLCQVRPGPHGRTRLMHAARAGNVARAVFLLSCGAAAGAADERGATALHSAAWPAGNTCLPGHVAVARLLVEHGAAVNAVDEGGYTPVSLSSNPIVFPRRNLAMVEALVQLGADLNLGNNFGMTDSVPSTTLTSAILLGRWEAATELVRLGANVDAPAGLVNAGHNSLSLACQLGEVDKVRRLLDLGANILFTACAPVCIPLLQLVVMNNGQHEAEKGVHLKLFKLLLARGASTAAAQGIWGEMESLDEMLEGYRGTEEYGLFRAALNAHEAAHRRPQATGWGRMCVCCTF